MTMNGRDLMLRLLKYKRILRQFRDLGLERVFSNNLGDALGISAALVRKDFSRMGFEGNRRGGYRIDDLTREFERILGPGELKEVVVIGCGNIGKALINHESFVREGIRIAAAFDIKPPSAEISGIPVYPMEILNDFVREHRIQVGIISVPADAASQVRDAMAEAGIRGVLNFAPVELKSSETCLIQNVNIGLELENLFFRIILTSDTKGALHDCL
jgi:redox-sensing transcriptional repressor